MCEENICVMALSTRLLYVMSLSQWAQFSLICFYRTAFHIKHADAVASVNVWLSLLNFTSLSFVIVQTSKMEAENFVNQLTANVSKGWTV